MPSTTVRRLVICLLVLAVLLVNAAFVGLGSVFNYPDILDDYLGIGAAALIAVGVLVPLDVPGADFANFVGYIVWSLWLLTFATLLWRRPERLEHPAAQHSGRQAAGPVVEGDGVP